MRYHALLTAALFALLVTACDGTKPATRTDQDNDAEDTDIVSENALPDMDNDQPDPSDQSDQSDPSDDDALFTDDLLSDDDSLLPGDHDGDGIPDSVEKPGGIAVDTDNDGIPDFKDDDSDGDGIPDAVECPDLPCRDTDKDGVPDYRDKDSDDDGIFDAVEAGVDPTEPVDSDGDGISDHRDIDADNDGIKDLYEGIKDADGDTVPNYLDLDGDGDGVPDCIERYGKVFKDIDLDGQPDCKEPPDYAGPPADTDSDGRYDFLDTDSDGDGLGDDQEVVCPNLQKDGRVFADVDGDGFSDLAERAVGSKVCDPTEGVTDMPGVDFYFELPYEEPEKTDTLLFTPSVQKADIFFNIDTTGSMDGELYNLKHTLSSTIIPQTRQRITDSAFGVSQFKDEDELSLIQTDPVTDTMTAQLAVSALTEGYGGDCPEAGYFSLHNLGENGQWRLGAIPLVVHITDAPSHERGADKASALAALNAKGTKVITVLSTGGCDTATAQTQLTELSDTTGATVPECAGAGRTTLMYSVDENGNGLDTAIVNGIDALVRYALFDVYAAADDDGETGTTDTACFLKKIEATAFFPPPGDTCAPTATAAALNGASYDNGFTNFVTGTSNPLVTGSSLTFTVHAQNDTCVPPLEYAQVFTALIHIVDAGSAAILDTQKVTIIVPGVIKPLDES